MDASLVLPNRFVRRCFKYGRERFHQAITVAAKLGARDGSLPSGHEVGRLEQELELREVVLQGEIEVRSEESDHIADDVGYHLLVLRGDPLELREEVRIQR